MIPSKYQQAVYEYIQEGEGSVVVIAVAGSGKTTTALGTLDQIPSTHPVQFFAFNAAVAKTLRERIPPGASHVNASTFHSVGYNALKRHWGLRGLEVNDQKVRQLARTLIPSYSERQRYEGLAVKLVALAKGQGVGALTTNTYQVWADLIAHHDLFLDDAAEDRVITYAQRLLQASIDAAEENFSIDFDDQLYLPVLWDTPIQPRPWVLIDEAQDTNPVRRRLAGMTLGEGGRLMAVGDPQQAIYGFTGASHDAIDLIRNEWNAVELPLSICYRCGIAIVEYAQRIVPQIEPAPDAGPGLVDTITERKLFQTLTASDAILCRNNAPLVSLAYRAIAAGVSCQILGRDIGRGLQQLVDKMRAGDLDDLVRKLEAYRAREVKKYHERDQTAKAESVNDRVDCIQTLIDNLPETEYTLPALGDALDRLFGDSVTNRLTLSTVHKAKGREWPTVAILRPDLMPAPWAKGWQLDQEHNLQYVAWTRAREVLYFVEN